MSERYVIFVRDASVRVFHTSLSNITLLPPPSLRCRLKLVERKANPSHIYSLGMMVYSFMKRRLVSSAHSMQFDYDTRAR